MQQSYYPGGGQDDSIQKVEIVISCRSLRDADVFSKSDPFVIFKVKNNKTGQWYEVGRTETIQDNLNPNFKRSFMVDYMFEVKQEAHFEVLDDDGGNQFDHLGECFTTIGAIVGARNNTLILDLNDKKTNKKVGKSKIIFIADKISECNDFIFTQWCGVKLMNTDGWFDKSDPFLRFKRIKEGNTSILAHETEVIMDNLNPVWKPVEMSCQKLNNGDHLRPIKVECWDWEKSLKFQFIGEFEFTVDEAIKGKREFILKNPKHKKPGMIQLKQFVFVQKPSFLQYIRGNTQLNCILAVDFTASNGAVSTPESLHYQNPQLMNQYQQAIVGVGEILLDYDTDKRVACYGFGGVPRYPNLRFPNTQHCFPMSGMPENTEACGLNEIMNLYSFSLQHVSLSGPTYFNPILTETIKITEQCKREGSIVYNVLMILTDGEIHDMDATINSLVYASDQPLSVIIIGIGNADFTNMERLDGDVTGLIDSQGRRSTRDLVQFVPFRQYKGDLRVLTQEVLREIPDQLVKYMVSQGIKPQPAQNINASQVNINYGGANAVQNLAQGLQGFLSQHINNNQGPPAPPPPPPPASNNNNFGGGDGGNGGLFLPPQDFSRQGTQGYPPQQQQQQLQGNQGYPNLNQQQQLQQPDINVNGQMYATQQFNQQQHRLSYSQAPQQLPGGMFASMNNNQGAQQLPPQQFAFQSQFQPQQQQQLGVPSQFPAEKPVNQPAYPAYGFNMAHSTYDGAKGNNSNM